MQMAAASAAAAPRTAPPPPPYSIVDMRTLDKPRSFDGRKWHWRGYLFGISAYAAAVEPQLGDLMSSAATVTEADTMLRVLNTDQKRMSTKLYYMLALSIDSDTSALTIVERAGP